MADLGHIARRSGVAAFLDVLSLPLSPALREGFEEDAARDFAVGGGDDYELCFTAAHARRQTISGLSRALDLSLTRVGRITAGVGVHGAMSASRGYEHFL